MVTTPPWRGRGFSEVKAMRRLTASRSLGLLLVCSTAAVARDDGPPLSAPADLPPVLDAVPAPASDHRPVLVIPGLIPSRGAPARTSLPALEPTGPVGDLPALVGPSDMPAPELLAPLPSTVSPGRRAGELPLETVPEGTLDPYPGAKPRLQPTTREETAPPPAPSRRFRLFGRVAPAPIRGNRGSSKPSPADAPITVEPRSDPAADAALKRRLDRQIREAAGDKLRSLDVRVIDRSVHIQAKPSRFWQRRALRHTLETLPALDGYKTTIDVDE
jgi:hypothetical protein